MQSDSLIQRNSTVESWKASGASYHSRQHTEHSWEVDAFTSRLPYYIQTNPSSLVGIHPHSSERYANTNYNCQQSAQNLTKYMMDIIIGNSEPVASTSARTYSSEEWEQKRAIITQLYRDEEKSLDHVRSVLAHQSFRPT
jgi:hypothetical protein